MTITEDRDRTEDLFFVDLDTMYPAISSAVGTGCPDSSVEVLMCSRRRLLAAILLAASALVACDSDDSTSSAAPEPFGAARVEPSSAAIGKTFSIEPTGEVQPLCMNVLTVLEETDSGDLEREGWLSPDGDWQQFGQQPEPTIASCLPEPSAAARTFTVPEEIESGSYVVCLSAEPGEAGCGRIAITG